MAASCSVISQLVGRMTLQEKVAQITQLDINEIMDHEAARQGHLRLDPDKVGTAVSAGVGSFLNSPTAGGPQGKLDSPTAAQWRDALSYLETAYIDAGKVCTRPPLLRQAMRPDRPRARPCTIGVLPSWSPWAPRPQWYADSARVWP